MMPYESASPYLTVEPPTSPGRVLLSRAFSHWCGLHFGYSDDEIVAALDAEAQGDNADIREIRFAARLLGELLCAGEMRAFTRPFGGGNPQPMATSAWERDDYRPVFARSAIDPGNPFDHCAPATHWVFLDADDFNRVIQLSLGQCDGTRPEAEPTRAGTAASDMPPPTGNHVRMPELERRTGMSRATIYRRIAASRFPSPIPMDGNIAVWREGEVAEWLANPR